MERFAREYAFPLSHSLQRPLCVLEVGSRDINGSYRPIFDDERVVAQYVGIDVTDGPGVNFVVEPHHWSFKIGYFDVIICGQTLEHDPKFWLTLEQIRNSAKPGTLACIIAPGCGPQHNPPDYYRFLPHAPKVWAELLGAELLESWWDEKSPHCDCRGNLKWDER